MAIEFVLLPKFVNKVYRPWIRAGQRYQLFFGGSSSGKSYFLAERALCDLLDGHNYLVVRNVQKTLRQSAFNEIKKAVDLFQISKYFTINKTEMTITCLLNNKQILFCGLDDTEKIKSITPAMGVIDTIWIEEATEIEYQAFKQLDKRLRGISDFKKRIILSFNPILKSHWIFKQFFKEWDDSKTLFHNEYFLILKTIYRDNAFLEVDDVKALEDETDPYFYNVYTLGNWGILGNVIFKKWKTADLSSLLNTFDKRKNGLDFGFSSDPASLVRSHCDKKEKKLYIFDTFYCHELTNNELAEQIKERIKDELLYCDSAEPKSIRELQVYRVNAIPVKKGPDSVKFGLRWLQGFELIIDFRCQEFINEIQTYKWKEDKDGNVLPIPVDKFNHGIDALRYSYQDEILVNDEDDIEIMPLEGAPMLPSWSKF